MNKQMGNILLHIGYHKTGTSWLQNEFFCKNPDLYCPVAYNEIVEHIVYPNSLDFNSKETQDFFIQKNTAAEKIAVISCERLSGNPHSGGYDSKEIADRLYLLFPKAKVLIVLRNQIAAIASNYKQNVLIGGVSPLKEYLKGHKPERYPAFNLKHFCYDRLILYYYSLFGREKIFVSFYEDFKNNPQQFIQNLCQFLEISNDSLFNFNKRSNPSLSIHSIHLLRRLNHFYRHPMMPYHPLFSLPGWRILRNGLRAMDAMGLRSLSKQDSIKTKIKAYCGDYFVPSNQRLQAILKTDIKKRGYEVESS